MNSRKLSLLEQWVKARTPQFPEEHIELARGYALAKEDAYSFLAEDKKAAREAALAQQAQPEDGTGYCQDCELPVKGDDVVHTHCAGAYFSKQYPRTVRTRSTDMPQQAQPDPKPTQRCFICDKVGCRPMNHAGWDPTRDSQ